MSDHYLPLIDRVGSEGALDPFHYMESKSKVDAACSLLLQVNPWGATRSWDIEIGLSRALRYGALHGARYTGEALRIAQRNIAASLPAGMVEVAEAFARDNSTFRLAYGPVEEEN